MVTLVTLPCWKVAVGVQKNPKHRHQVSHLFGDRQWAAHETNVGRHWSSQAAMTRQGCEVRSAHRVKQQKGSSGWHLLTRVIAEEDDIMTWQNLCMSMYSYILVPENLGNILATCALWQAHPGWSISAMQSQQWTHWCPPGESKPSACRCGVGGFWTVESLLLQSFFFCFDVDISPYHAISISPPLTLIHWIRTHTYHKIMICNNTNK